MEEAVADAGAVRATPVRGHLDVRLFGHIELTLDGERLALATPRKSLQVLAYLLLHRGTAVSREYLAFLLYPDDEEPSARAKLRATLAELPKILPKPADRFVAIDTDKIGWNPQADVWLDVDAFVEAANDRSRLTEAVALYRADLLPEVYDEWLDVIRERLRNVYLRCLSDVVSDARRSANLALGMEAARKLLTVDPWREDIVRRLMAMRYASGDRAGALSEYAAFAKRLAGELGSEPMPETVAVAERIARGQALQDFADDDDRAVVVDERAVLPFVGRRDEMDRLLQAWSRVVRGRGACAFVGGETGVGKSRLVTELANAVEERGGRVLVGTTGSPEAIPYESVVDALRSALPLVASLKPSVALASVAAVLPEIHARLTLPALPHLDAASERIRLFESIFRCIAELAAPRPLLLVLEDLHWAQPASIDLVQFLSRRLAGFPVMIVMTYRDEELPRPHALHRLRRDARTSSSSLNLWLGGFTAGDVDDLRAALPAIRDRSVQALLAASQGNPLFFTQLVSDASDGEPSAAPASLQEAVERRIERLSERARAIAEIAACIGDQFSREAVREVSAWDEAPLTQAIDELLDRRIIREAGGRGVFEYAFAHNLVHDTIARSIPIKDAAVRRRRVARVLEELYPERFPELSATLAAHYESAGDAANAARCYLESVRRSIAIGALEEARAMCEHALTLDLPLHPRVELLLERATIESRGGHLDARNAALVDLERAERELGDPIVHRETLQQRIEYAAAATDLKMQASAIRALRECVPETDMEWSAVVHLAEGKLYVTRGELGQAYAEGEAALQCSRSAGDDGSIARALCFLAKVEGFRGNLSAGVALYEEAAVVAARAADPALELLALGSGWMVAYQHRDLQRCRTLAERCVELAAKLGDRPAEAQSLGRLGVVLLASDAHVAEARRKFAAATRISEETGDRLGTAIQLINRSVLESKMGFFDRAADATRKSVVLFERAGDERGRIGALANLIYIYACTKDFKEAREAADEALEDARRHEFGLIEAAILENLAFAEGTAGNFQRAIELAETSFTLRARSESGVWSSKTLADIAIWYANCGNLAAAMEAIRRLLADDDAIARGSDWPTYCYWSAAQILRLAGDASAAARALQRAYSLMQTGADALDPEDRASYLALPFHRDLERAAVADEWPNPPR